MSYSTWADFVYYKTNDVAEYNSIAYQALQPNKNVVPTGLAPNWALVPTGGGGGGGDPVLMYSDTTVGYIFNATPYENILRFWTPPYKTFPTGTILVRLTYSINVKGGLPTGEQLFLYTGLEDDASPVVETYGDCFTISAPYLLSITPNASADFGATTTIVDYVPIPSTAVGYRPFLYGIISSGTHTADLEVIVSAEVVV